MAISFAVSEWTGWASPDLPAHQGAMSHAISPAPDVSVIPSMLRRRLNNMGRACANAMLQHLHKGDNPPIVFCSRHGDIERTLGVLLEMASGEPVLPMNFSLGVHNAIAGVISIHQAITANISSIAAGDETIVPVLLEALGQLDSDCTEVLCLICDFPLPEIYQDNRSGTQTSFTVCLQVTASSGTQLVLEREEIVVDPANGECLGATTSPLEFIEFLSSDRKLFTTIHNGSRWNISKSGQL